MYTSLDKTYHTPPKHPHSQPPNTIMISIIISCFVYIDLLYIYPDHETFMLNNKPSELRCSFSVL